MTTTIDNLLSNKRKFISDDEINHPSTRILSTANQAESSCNTKKIKFIVTERLPLSTTEIDESDDMMICESSNLKETDTTDKSQAALAPKHCNDMYNDNANPMIFSIRCYCDPYRLNGWIPYHSDIF